MRALLLLACGLALVGCGGAQSRETERQQAAPTAGGKKSLDQRLFAPTSIWNQPLPRDAPLDPASARLSASVAGMASEGSALDVYSYSVPLYIVGPRQRRRRVVPDVPNVSLHRALAAVPLPAGAHPAPGTDAHLAVYQPSSDTMWEFWRLHRTADGWHCGYGGRMTSVSRSPGYFRTRLRSNGRPLEQDYWGATATGLALAGGLVLPSELRRGTVDHALAIGLPRIRAGVRALPAIRSDGRYADADAVPEGAHFRLDPELDLDSLRLSPVTRTLARAAQRYGLVVRDGGAEVALYAQDPASLPSDPYPDLLEGLRPSEILQDFPWDHLQLLRMKLRADDR